MLVSLVFLSLFHSKSSKLRTEKNFERFYTLVVVTVKITIFWDDTVQSSGNAAMFPRNLLP